MKKLWTPVLVFIIFLIAFVATLIYGIRIESFTVGGVSVRQLYIKLDKKLIVEALHVKLPMESSQNSTREEFVQLLEYLPWLNRLFDTISVGVLSLGDESIKLTYKHDTFYLDSNYLTIDAKLGVKAQHATVYLQQMLLKDFNLELRGDLNIDIFKESGFFEGEFETHGIKGRVAIKLQDRMLSYVAKTQSFESLEPFMEALEETVHVEPEISEWVYKRIGAKEYKINSLSGQIDLESGEYFPYKMRGDADVKDVSVRFHDDVPSANIENLRVRLENNQLLFDIGKAQYEGIDISRSNVYIYNLLTQKNGIIVTIQADTALDEKVHKILHAYDIFLPINQTKGKSKAVLELDIDFLPYDLDAKGYFILNNSTLEIEGEPFEIKSAYVSLDNRDVYLDATRIAYKDLFDIRTQGVLDTKALNYIGTASIERLHVEYENRPIIDSKEALTPVVLDFNNGLHVNLPDFKTKLSFAKNSNSFELQNLSLWATHAPLLDEFNIKNGNATIVTDDFEKFHIKAQIDNIQTPLIKNKEPLRSFDFEATVSSEGLKLDALGLKIQEDGNKRQVYLDNIDINSDSNFSTKAQKPMELLAQNSKIYFYDTSRFLEFDKYQIMANKNSLSLDGNLSLGGEIEYFSNQNEISLDISDLSDSVLNDFAQKELLKEGVFSLLLRGKDSKNYSGNLSIESTYLVQMNAYNNLIALINTLPSLAMFKSPGFNENGYEIKNGNILFTREGDTLILHAIDLNGVSADILGKGVVDLKNDTMEVSLQLKTLKDISGILGKIPLVNHILLGDDKSISTAITLTGSLSDPKVETQVLQDTLVTPFNILRRTMELPFKLFNE
jgi:hypothetical protein